MIIAHSTTRKTPGSRLERSLNGSYEARRPNVQSLTISNLRGILGGSKVQTHQRLSHSFAHAEVNLLPEELGSWCFSPMRGTTFTGSSCLCFSDGMSWVGFGLDSRRWSHPQTSSWTYILVHFRINESAFPHLTLREQRELIVREIALSHSICDITGNTAVHFHENVDLCQDHPRAKLVRSDRRLW